MPKYKKYKRRTKHQWWQKGSVPWNKIRNDNDDSTTNETPCHSIEDAACTSVKNVALQYHTPGTNDKLVTTVAHEENRETGTKKIIISMRCAASSSNIKDAPVNNTVDAVPQSLPLPPLPQPGPSDNSSSSSSHIIEESQNAQIIKRPVFTECLSSTMQMNDPLKPTKLRPTKSTVLSNTDEASVNENAVVNLHQLEKLIALFTDHNKGSCVHPDPKLIVTRRQGLCIDCTCRCRNCSFSSDKSVKLYTECRVGTRGPKSGTLNESLMLSALKTKVGPSDLNFILAALNVKPPSDTLMYKKLNRLCDMMVRLNDQAMVESQRFVRDFLQSIGRESNISVETDSSFNNRIQAGFEASTSSFSPMIEQETGFSLPLSAVVYNKVCSVPSCKHDSQKCHRNYKPDESMSSSESKAAADNLQKVHAGNCVTVTSVTTDASAQVENAIRNHSARTGRNISHQLCFIHRMRTLQKNVKKVELSSIPLPQKEHAVYMQKLATCVRHRVRRELTCASRLHGPTNFVDNAWPAISSVIKCFSGNHTNCKRVSLVCKAHLQSYSTKFLPFGQHLNLSNNDKTRLQTAINKIISKEILAKLRNLSTTNKSETMHRRVFTYAPKYTAWPRNFKGMCASGLHSSKHGTGMSAIILSEAINVTTSDTDPFRQQMFRRDKLANLSTKRKKTDNYKIKRYNTRKQKCNRTIRVKSLYNLEDPSIRNEHCYGLDVNKH